MLSPSEYTKLYKTLDEYFTSDACKTAFIKSDGSGVDYNLITLCVDELICEEFAYANPNKISDKVNKLNGKNDFDKTLIALKNQKKEVVATFKYSDIRD
jgi:hypothetical protein